MEGDLKSLRIDRSKKQNTGSSAWAKWWIIIGISLFLLVGVGNFVYSKWNAAVPVELYRVELPQAGSTNAGAAGSQNVILNATGYIVAHHKIQVASKVLGKVAWIGVDKGYFVKEGQVIARLEDDEYRAQLQQATGNLNNLKAKLAELENGSRPQEVASSKSNWEVAKADLENARVSLERVRKLVAATVAPQQQLDDAVARFESQKARVDSLEKIYDLVRVGPRREVMDAMRGQIEQAQGNVSFYQTQLSNTVIKAPSTGTILERAVEKGEFITTSFVGDRGAKGYVVSLADLKDLQVELDINQNDFRKLNSKQKGVITTDAFPDKKYEGIIDEISPEANRQKATVQVKVKVLQPDEFMRPEMNASVAFYDEASGKPAAGGSAPAPAIIIPAAAVKNGKVLLMVNGKAMERAVKLGATSSMGVRVESGLIGGEDIIMNPPADVKDGVNVTKKL